MSERASDIWTAYLQDRRQEVSDQRRMIDCWMRLEPFFGERIGNGITKDDCRAYASMRTRQGRANSTIKTELDYLRAALNFHYGRGRVAVWTP
ncbi:MAG: hypothetical protein EOP83_36245, partial [Verrucomicrobiaceae bacterium]